MLPRYLAFASLLHLLVLVAGTAAATPKDPPLPRTMRLEYTRKPGAADCPDEDTFRYVVAGRMADSPFAPQAPDRMVVSIRHRGPSYQGLAEIRDATGASLWSFQTTLPECHLVTDALGIAIGLALDKPHPTKVEPPTPKQAANQQRHQYIQVALARQFQASPSAMRRQRILAHYAVGQTLYHSDVRSCLSGWRMQSEHGRR